MAFAQGICIADAKNVAVYAFLHEVVGAADAVAGEDRQRKTHLFIDD